MKEGYFQWMEKDAKKKLAQTFKGDGMMEENEIFYLVDERMWTLGYKDPKQFWNMEGFSKEEQKLWMPSLIFLQDFMFQEASWESTCILNFHFFVGPQIALISKEIQEPIIILTFFNSWEFLAFLICVLRFGSYFALYSHVDYTRHVDP